MTRPPVAPADVETGLPLLRTWREVYVAVVVAFCIWVAGLVALPFLFS